MVFAILGLLAAAGVWYWRLNTARDAARDIGDLAVDTARTLANAPRRFGFRRKANAHPVEGVDDPKLAVISIAVAFLELNGMPSREDQYALAETLSRQLALSRDDIDEMMILSRWLMGECQGPQPAITRLTKRLGKLDPAGFQTLLPILNDIGSRSGGLSPRQSDALDDIARTLKLR